MDMFSKKLFMIAGSINRFVADYQTNDIYNQEIFKKGWYDKVFDLKYLVLWNKTSSIVSLYTDK